MILKQLQRTFIGKYYPPTKIIQLRNAIMNFRKSDNEHLVQSQEIMESMFRNFPSHGKDDWLMLHSFMMYLMSVQGIFWIQLQVKLL